MRTQAEDLERLIEALDDFLESGETSEGYDPDELDCDALEEGGYVRLAVQDVQRHYSSNKLPAPVARNPWRSLLNGCRSEDDPLRRQNEAHRFADLLRNWAAREIQGLGTEAMASKSATLAVDESVEIGNRKEFHLLAILAASRNQYVSHADLAQRLGGDELDSVTHVKSRLTKLLRAVGLAELADRIKSQKGHYGLFIS